MRHGKNTPAALAKSFGFALRGLCHGVATQRNLRIHLVAAALALWLGWRLGLDKTAWAALWLAIGLVLAAELFNTSLEAAVDLASPNRHPLAAAAKDCAAAAVLVCALAAVGVGACLFWQPAALLEVWRGFWAQPATVLPPVLMVGLGAAFVLAMPYPEVKNNNKEQE